MSDEAALVQKRGRTKGTLTRIKAFAECIENTTDVEDIKVRLNKLEETWLEFLTIEDELLLLEGQESDMEEYEKRYFDTKAMLNRALRAFVQETRQSSTTTERQPLSSTMNSVVLDRSQLHLTNIRLPKINIPPFTGDYKEWPSFKDLYLSTIHENEGLTGSQKFQHLKGLLTGSAASVVRHLNVTDANYLEAWDRLLQRFDRSFHIATSYIKTFLDQPTLNNPSSKGLRNLTDTFDEVVRGLKGLGAEAEKRDVWLTYIAMSKLDHETREAWSYEIASKDFPSFNDFLMFLNKRCNALEACNVSSKRPTQSVKSMHLATTSLSNICPKCNQDHPIFRCEIFKNQSPLKRKEFVILKSLCFKCLGANHSVRSCRSKMMCNKCSKLHHPLLHDSTDQQSPIDPPSTPSSSSKNDTKSAINLASINSPTINTTPLDNASINTLSTEAPRLSLLPTALVKVKDNQGQFVQCRVLLDSGSQISLISESCAQRLNLQRENSRLGLTGVLKAELGTTRGKIPLQLSARWNQNIILKLQAYVLAKLTSVIPSTSLQPSTNAFPKGIQLADPTFQRPSEVDIIIGADRVFDVLKGGKLYDDTGRLFGQDTIFGWVAVGDWLLPSPSLQSFHLHACEDLDKTLRRFWEVEELTASNMSLTQEEEKCQTHFNQHLTIVGERYMVALPMKTEVDDLGESLPMAIKRLQSMERKFQRDPNLKLQYTQFMQEYEKLGHMELVPSDQLNKDCRFLFYLPHHAVFKASPNPKIRVVFDGSCKSSTGISLNNKLMVGPTIQNDLTTILLKFRQHRIAFCADVEKMYRQVLISPADRDYQRIVWREHPALPFKHYRLTTVTYGTASAPFLATRALHEIANEFETLYTQASSIIRTSFYVDDLLTGADTLTEALLLKENIRTMLASRGFNLTKWLSNSPEFIKDDTTNNLLENVMTIEENAVTAKILGIQWNSLLDVFTFKVSLSDRPDDTKRKILSESSKIFDPLGWLSPVTISVKILLQQLWLCEYSWDDILPNQIVQRWQIIKEQLPVMKTVQLPRCITVNKEHIQLHGFCDASELSYAAVVYCRSLSANKEVFVRLIAGKTKVAPLKQVSLPRLELCGALLLAQLMTKVADALEVKNIEKFAWTDSSVVLAWLSDVPRKWKTYVANRTSEIISLIPRSQWNHVASKENPADPASRGVSPTAAINLDIWWNGPEWLRNEPISSLHKKPPAPSTEAFSERRKSHTAMTLHQQLTTDVTEIFANHSSYSKSLRIIAYCLRFIQNSRSPAFRQQLVVTPSEIRQAELLCFRRVQQIFFQEEIQHLKANQPVASNSILAALCPFLDKHEILRVGGRLKNADYHFNAKHPIILPKNHPITQSLISELHKLHLHPGSSLLLGLIRQRFWIFGARNIVKKVNLQCIICFRQRAARSSQLMAHLPEARVTISRPFFNVGVDYGGPIRLCTRIGRGVRPIKGYFAVFVCMATRAVHLEAVTDLTAEAFVASLRRFVARRGAPHTIFCDNATNFVGGRKLVSELYNLALSVYQNPLISHFLSQRRITWSFIPPAAPHFGGIWEAAVKSTKWHLRRVVGESILSFEEFSTLLAQIEAILNSRPYGPLSSDPDDYNALTPSHFLIGEPLTLLPEGDYTEKKVSRLGRWQHIQAMIQGFWNRWKNEYLTSLQLRPKWRKEQDSFKEGELVLIGETNVPPSHWPLGRILAVHPGDDNLVRVVTVKSSHGTYKRPVTKIYRLPISQATA